MKDKILLFIPMYNCEKQITRVLNQINKEISVYITEIIVVNNRSTDNGEEVVKNYIRNTTSIPTKLLRNDDNYGLGGSHKVAFQYSIQHKFDYVIVLHGDDQGTINDLLPYLRNGSYKDYNCFLGARFKKSSKLEGYSLFRTFGNHVYNLMFSIVTKRRIYDLGAGLNMYSTSMLEDSFYFRFPDNLTFNYCMILASIHKKHSIHFFPISWREEDQVSNVKMVSQALKVLNLLISFSINKIKFLNLEHRIISRDEYSAEVIATNRQQNEAST